MTLTVRPIEQWPGTLRTDAQRQTARFSASWSDTVELLEREAEQLDARDVVLQMAVSERDCRLDGWIRADAKPAHPGVIVSLDSKHGPLRYSTDLFDGAAVWQSGGFRRVPGWQCNVRAIALGLEALRKVDRYGIGQGGEQYRGWQALPPGTPMPAAQMTIDEAARLLADESIESPLSGRPVFTASQVLEGAATAAYRIAVRRHHPDTGGDPETFRRLTEARDLLIGGPT